MVQNSKIHAIMSILVISVIGIFLISNSASAEFGESNTILKTIEDANIRDEVGTSPNALSCSIVPVNGVGLGQPASICGNLGGQIIIGSCVLGNRHTNYYTCQCQVCQ